MGILFSHPSPVCGGISKWEGFRAPAMTILQEIQGTKILNKFEFFGHGICKELQIPANVSRQF